MSSRSVSFSLLAASIAVAMARPSFAEGRGRGDDSRSARCYAIQVDAPDDTSGSRDDRHSRRESSVFSVTETKDLDIEISIPDELSTLPVQVKLFNPRGRLYQVLDATAASSTREAGPGNGRGRRARRTARSLVARLPVAGTQITGYGLFGEWRAEAYVDGAETPCARPVRFVIEP